MTYTTNLPNLQTCVTIFIILLFAYAAAWTVDGKWLGGSKDHYLDLIIPPERKSVWVNWYGTSSGGTEYKTREQADDYSLSHRTHVLEIVMENGEPVDVKIHKVTK